MSGRDLISKKARNEFREFLVGWTLREIEDEFSAADLYPDQSYNPDVSGQRRALVEQYYHNLDFKNPTDTQRVLKVYEAILAHCQTLLENPDPLSDCLPLKRTYENLLGCLRRDGYEFHNGRLQTRSRTTQLRHLSATATTLDAEYLAAQVDRLMEAVEEDSDLAIGQAKELVETCCKTILAANGNTDYDRLDLVALVKTTMKHLRLLPEDIPESAKGNKTIKAVLGNLAMISQGMAELRNLYGTGHGKHAKHKRLPVRHARLAVGAATTLANFLFETHEARSVESGQEKTEEQQ